MARIEVSLSAVECRCGTLHELVYVANQGAMGGGFKYRCGSDTHAHFDGNCLTVKTVTLGLASDKQSNPK